LIFLKVVTSILIIADKFGSTLGLENGIKRSVEDSSPLILYPQNLLVCGMEADKIVF